MSEYWDVKQFKKTKNGKNYAVKLGSAKKKDDGGFYIDFDALPLPDAEGRCSVTIMPQQERARPAQRSTDVDMNDDIGF
jgi:hypothetical protein